MCTSSCTTHATSSPSPATDGPSLVTRTYLVRGLVVGILAAVLALVFVKVAGEPQIAAAIRFEHAQARAAGEPDEPDLVSRSVQDTAGLGTGLLVVGAALGGIFGLAYAFAYGRLTRLRPRSSALLVAGGLFTVIVLVPFLKYPGNPPAVSNPDTLNHRTAVYFVLMLMAAGCLAVAIGAHRRLASVLGSWDAALASVAVFVALVMLAYAVTPRVDEMPDGFPAQVLWQFRLASIGTHLILWSAIGLGFGALTERHERRAVTSAVEAVRVA